MMSNLDFIGSKSVSVDSNAVSTTILGVPSAPTNVTITITVTVQ